MDSGLEKEGPGNTMKKKTSVLKNLWIAGALSLVIGASSGCALGRGSTERRCAFLVLKSWMPEIMGERLQIWKKR